jgi:DNA-binding IclR family transcriptional regulator
MGLAAPSSRMRADALREIAPTMLAAADRIRQEMSRPV